MQIVMKALLMVQAPSDVQDLSSMSKSELKLEQNAADAAVEEKFEELAVEKAGNGRVKRLRQEVASQQKAIDDAAKAATCLKRVAAAQPVLAVWEASLPASGDVLGVDMRSIFAATFLEAQTKVNGPYRHAMTF